MYSTMRCLFLFSLTLFFTLFFFSCTDESPSSQKQIVYYSIKAELNNLEKDFNGIINDETRTITLSSSLPLDKPLIATFDSKGTLYINNVIQESNITANLYKEGLTYTVVAEDGSTIDYIVKFDNITWDDFEEYKVEFIQDGESIIIEGKSDPETGQIKLWFPNLNWIENVDAAVATFKSSGEVYVGEAIQKSSITGNDFRKEVIYTVLDIDNSRKNYYVRLMAPQASGIPVIKIDTENGLEVTDKKNYMSASFLLDDINHPEFFIDSETTIRGRGNTTWNYAKKPYRIKFEKKTSLFGLGKAKSWVLLANYLDPTFITANVAFELGHRLGVPYTNHAFNVELFFNGEYRGNYVLTEQVQVNEYRVNIDEEKDMLIELDDYYDADYKFLSTYRQIPVNIKSPDLTSESQIIPIKEAFATLEQRLFDEDYDFPNNDYKEIIDIDALINYFLVNEIVRNRELYHPKSTYMSKTEKGKFIMGPLWDFDMAFGCTGRRYQYFQNPEGLIIHRGMRSTDVPSFTGVGFFSKFFHDPEFISLYKKRWNEVRPLLNDIEMFIDELGNNLSYSAYYDEQVWSEPEGGYKAQIEGMKNFLKIRINDIDKRINEM